MQSRSLSLNPQNRTVLTLNRHLNVSTEAGSVAGETRVPVSAASITETPVSVNDTSTVLTKSSTEVETFYRIIRSLLRQLIAMFF